MAGDVRVKGAVIDKPGFLLASLDEVVLKASESPYVSRGGLKLAAALDIFQIDPTGQVCLDIGASTGGFTDCLLQHGAAQVFAIDVGYGQLAWKLRQDSRVVTIERTNARYLAPEDLYPAGEPPATLAVMDVSFISILKILPALGQLLARGGQLLSLIKPQFEAGKDMNTKGIVRSLATHRQVLADIAAQAPAWGFWLYGLIPSPIRGKDGNIEFLGLFKQEPAPAGLEIEQVVKTAHSDTID